MSPSPSSALAEASAIPPTPKPKYVLSTAESFIAGGIAACGSVTFTNPFEVAKTRLQLQGELQAKGTQKVYNNAFDALRKTWKFEGIRGVQSGLTAAYGYQMALNGCRLGFYDLYRTTLNRLAGVEDVTAQHAWSSVAAGASSGVTGGKHFPLPLPPNLFKHPPSFFASESLTESTAILGNPLFLIKARMQAYSSANPVGAQHKYKSPLHGLQQIMKKEGTKGIFRGVDAAMFRTACGSSVQLPAYNFAKIYLSQYMPSDSVFTYILASTFSGACVCLVMQPADTALTRMYNQSPDALGPDGKPRGLLYKNPFDCLWKTFKVEGIRGWYKGSTAHLLRIAPHTVLTLVFNEFVIAGYQSLRS
ncbi:mitochondrial carrier [Atractiella rhizophila]|nr:mitochondrial carrier [Atractiella rhizophila]